MTAHRISCASCGAPIGVPADVDHLTCVYCGASMVVQRGEGYVALKLAEEVGRAIEKTGLQTQASIRQGTEVTQVELRRLQLSQELSAVQLQLSNVQAEMRLLPWNTPGPPWSPMSMGVSWWYHTACPLREILSSQP